MGAITDLFFVEGDILQTCCNIIAILLALEFVATIVSYLSRIGR